MLKVEKSGGVGRTMGVVVDAVSDVHEVPTNKIKPSPDFGTTVDTEFVKGLATVGEKMVIVLDIDHMLNADELASLEAVIE